MIKKQINILLLLSLLVGTRTAAQEKPFDTLALNDCNDVKSTSSTRSAKRTSEKKVPQKIHNLPSQLEVLEGCYNVCFGTSAIKSYGYLYNIRQIVCPPDITQFPLPFDNGLTENGEPTLHNMIFDKETRTVTLANQGTYLFIFSEGSANGYEGNKVMKFNLRIYNPLADEWRDYPSRGAYTEPGYTNPGVTTTGYAIAQNVPAGSSVGIVSYWSRISINNPGTGTLNAGTDAGPNVSLLIIQIG
ncbi:MAG: hypothetical protein NT124_03140 [Candidatus Dependentiae bacterium]|nr:hypothetical protein [Candidatus Dependentiae bacterium]